MDVLGTTIPEPEGNPTPADISTPYEETPLEEDQRIKTLQGRMAGQKFTFFNLKELQILCTQLGVSRGTAGLILKALRIPLVYLGNATYFNQSALERILYTLSRYGGKGFAAPGSAYKGKHLYRKKRTANTPLVEVDDKLQKIASNPLTLVEMRIAASSVRPSDSLLKMLISQMETK